VYVLHYSEKRMKSLGCGGWDTHKGGGWGFGEAKKNNKN
jgi:hypothetical protein